MLAISMVYIVAALILWLAWYFNYVILDVPYVRSMWLIVMALLVWAILYNANPLLKFISTQTIILIFLVINRNIPGFKLLIGGIVANATPTIANGYGLMPVAAELMPYLYQGDWLVYGRIGWSVVLPANEIAFYWLSDWIYIATVGKAYSPGDFLILTSGLWMLGRIARFKDGVDSDALTQL